VDRCCTPYGGKASPACPPSYVPPKGVNQRLVQESWIAGQRGYNVESCPPLHLLSCTPVGGKAKLILALSQLRWETKGLPPFHLSTYGGLGVTPYGGTTGGTTAYPFPPLVHTFHLLSQLVHLLTYPRRG
jgi:hypothetical protein